MNWRKLLAGIAIASILAAGVGALASLPGTFGVVAAVAVGALLVVAMLAVVGGGLRGTGGARGARTPYW